MLTQPRALPVVEPPTGGLAEETPGPEDFLNPASACSGERWKSWVWQQQKAIRRFDQLRALVPWLEAGVDATARYFNLAITPYYLSLIDRTNPNDPLAQMVIPSRRELVWQPEELPDPIGDRTVNEDMNNAPTRAIVHRYPDRCLLFLTPTCASYCRYCFRREIVSKAENLFPTDLVQESIAYIRATTAIKEVILSGGDPLTLQDQKLGGVLAQLDSIEHLRAIRLHSRFPVFNPFRVTDELCRIFDELRHPVWMVVHVCHPREVTPEFEAAMRKLRRAGVGLLNQSVLLARVNDDVETLKELSYRLASCGVKPYYLHYMDLAQGTSHFRVPIFKAMDLMKQLRGHLSGYMIPELILDIPSGYGKIRMEHSFVREVRAENGRVVLTVESSHVPGKLLRYEEVLSGDPPGANGGT